jgi:DNA-binding HxlR family transcriptional regulator
VRRKTFADAACPVARSLDQVGDWWSLLIVRDALDGVRRFTDFQKSLGLAKNILAMRLSALVSHGILRMQPASDGSAYQEYVLTEKGESLRLVLAALHQWGEDYLFAPGEHPPALVDKASGEPVARLRLSTQDGHELRPSGVEMRRVKPGA